MANAPWFWIVGGANGAGKTTFALEHLSRHAEINTFINADLIAKDLNPKHPDLAAVASARLMLERMHSCIQAKESFAIESTLASLAHLQTCHRLRKEGWNIGLVYLWLVSAKLSIRRVSERVLAGGHFIPDEVVIRRREKSLKLLPSYMGVASKYLLFDNTHRPASLVAWAMEGQSLVLAKETYELIQRGE